jgi:sigma-B regulation protein RsbU (phosphoserine phosphatase)
MEPRPSPIAGPDEPASVTVSDQSCDAFPGAPSDEQKLRKNYTQSCGRIASRPDCLRLVRAMVNEAGDASGCSGDCTSQMVMAVDEACQNIIRHAYGGDPDGEIVVDIRRQDDRIAIHLLDYAAPVDVSKIKPRQLDDVKPGGLGTHFIQECMDECGFLSPPDGTGNCLRLVKKIT